LSDNNAGDTLRHIVALAAGARNSRHTGYTHAFRHSVLVALYTGSFLSVLAWSLSYYFANRREPLWWASLPYEWTHALSFLILPGWIVWSVMLAAKNSTVLALFLGFVTDALVYSVLLYFPVLALELTISGARNWKS
jgi:hypothetical protein